MEFQDIFRDTKVYRYDQMQDLMDEVRTNFRFSWENKKVRFFNVPACFDIETSSFYAHGEKVAIMYIWTLSIYGAVMVGRTWDELQTALRDLSRILDLTSDKRFIIYVHNLSYEFQFIRKHFVWDKVFAIDRRKPLYAITDSGIEFRCSYLLSGYSLAKLGDQLHKYEVRKLSGDLDYTKTRHRETPLTPQEMQYCINDVQVVVAYIQEYIERVGGIAKIPLTKTGVVRKYCRDSCFYEPDPPRKGSHKRRRYKDFINGLVLDPEEYRQLKRAFQGGFTHANAFYSGKILQDVTSYDFTSSYPTVMIAEKFPMGPGERVEVKNKEYFEHCLTHYCCLFDVEFINIYPRVTYEHYISRSRCWHVKDCVTDNGRIVGATEIRTTITEQDFLIIRELYTWEEMRASNFRRYIRGYLPTDFVKSILTLYQDKTTLKGVEGKEIEYLASKEMLNSCYGMAVTDIVRQEHAYTDDWEDPVEPDHTEAIDKYNKNPGRFLFYPWGVWVTAYARRNLFTGIMEFGTDYVYSDTDSVKVLRADAHADYLRDYNERIQRDIERALDFHGIPREAAAPKTIKGETKPLGVWDFDGHYSRFKTLGAKRYLVQYAESDKVQMTVAGLNKKSAVAYLLDQHGPDGIFEAFSDHMYIPPDHTGKSTHTYIDTERAGIVEDYTGTSCSYRELSGVHLEAADYSLTISREYADYLSEVEDIS